MYGKLNTFLNMDLLQVSTTPHPEQCKIFMGSHHRFVPKHRTDFRTMVVQIAMERALHAQIHMKELRNHCHSKHEKAVWTDCSKLISNTIFQLNNTIQGLKTTKNCTGIDAQTWLSTALTNLETCRVGSVELNVSRFISPIMSNNVSELISNSLAINGGFLGKQKTRAGFPSWVSDRERRLLQSPSLASQANYIVGQEGSGHFRSIQAAINYAVSKRRGNGRIIIYVKKGVYTENIEISNYMNKLTLVGDGLRYTIITGSRSVATGFTTYSSATVGKSSLLLDLILYDLNLP
ncbi:plant invertase/pectin methylesterase inhibitor superfamily [Actinidia rufa]|uniref:Plant invertase/pectin methylesterase inhibitor superfamily n=1 Tax=Actinidia rufa TaxID=165716 RepID=A0A7J0ECW6_9ERIC|nr:plant invertase/pectin methylesterase inhibitor superfamily [Actinidia rufa]